MNRKPRPSGHLAAQITARQGRGFYALQSASQFPEEHLPLIVRRSQLLHLHVDGHVNGLGKPRDFLGPAVDQDVRHLRFIFLPEVIREGLLAFREARTDLHVGTAESMLDKESLRLLVESRGLRAPDEFELHSFGSGFGDQHRHDEEVVVLYLFLSRTRLCFGLRF